MSQSASLVVNRPVSVIEAHFWPVTNWASCLADVASARRVAHERYLMELRSGRRTEEVMVAVRWNARHRRFAWKALEGPTWSGELTLTPVNGRRTRLSLSIVTVPRTLAASFGELFGGGGRDLSGDLFRLQDLIEMLPESVRPARAEVGVRMPELDVAALTVGRAPVVPVAVPAAVALA